ncbi:hypothetical protein [Gemmiger formicilis]
MTGKEFLEMVRNIKKIKAIEWEVEGEPLDADCVKVTVYADDGKFSILVGYPKTTAEIDFVQQTSLKLIINKIMQQEGLDKSCDDANLEDMINIARAVLNAGNGEKNGFEQF